MIARHPAGETRFDIRVVVERRWVTYDTVEEKAAAERAGAHHSWDPVEVFARGEMLRPRH